jgi:hypothetical protein
MIQKLKLFWASLPHQVQAAIVTFGTAAGVTIAHAIEDGTMPSNWPAIKHLLATAVVSGVAALRLFYMLPNRSNGSSAPSLPPDVPKAA